MTPPVNPFPRKKVAIVGTGCTGIAALWALNRTHHDVYLYEAADRLGGHTNTVEWKCGKYKTLVDTGFIVMNAATYREPPSLPLSTPVLPALNECCLVPTPLTAVMYSQLLKLSRKDSGTNGAHVDDIWSISKWRHFRVGRHQSRRGLLPEKKYIFSKNVENALRHHSLQPIRSRRPQG